MTRRAYWGPASMEVPLPDQYYQDFSMFEPKIRLSKRTGDVLATLTVDDMIGLANDYLEFAMNDMHPWDPGAIDDYLYPAVKRDDPTKDAYGGMQVVYAWNRGGELEVKKLPHAVEKAVYTADVWASLAEDMRRHAYAVGVEEAMQAPEQAMAQAIQRGVIGRGPADASLQGTAMPFGTTVRKGAGVGGTLPFGTGAVRIENAAVRVRHPKESYKSWGPEFRVDYSPKDIEAYLQREKQKDAAHGLGTGDTDQHRRNDAFRRKVLRPARKRGMSVIFNEGGNIMLGDRRSIIPIRTAEAWFYVLHFALPWYLSEIIHERAEAAGVRIPGVPESHQPWLKKSSRRTSKPAKPKEETGFKFGTAVFGTETRSRPPSGAGLPSPGRGRAATLRGPSRGGAPASAMPFGTGGAAPPAGSGAFKFGGGGRSKNPPRRTAMSRQRNKRSKAVPIGCPPGEVLIKREAYDRRAYTRKDGTKVPASHVDATRYCTEDRGAPGIRSFGAKGAKGKYAERAHEEPLITRHGKLGGAGYTKRPVAERHAILQECVQNYGYRSCLGSLQVMLLGKAQKGHARQVFQDDKNWLVRTFGGPGSFGPRQQRRTLAVAANPGEIKRLKNRCM